jgi:2-C-methyl-D-erythritol 4-phosphate cytidylyltransferase
VIVGLIPAAGSGTRIGGALPKQYQEICGRPLLCYALEACAAVQSLERVHVVVAPEDTRFARLQLSAAARARVQGIAVGGASRHESVLNGLVALRETLAEDDWVVVHDAARPGIEAALIEQLIATVQDDSVGGLLALPLADTLKRAASSERRDARVVETVERAGLWQAQTPQMFRYGLLRRALQSALDRGSPVTDEASAVEALGLAPRLVTGSLRNFKVTYPEDLELAGLILGGRS